jgi:hypothetical protein
MIERAAGLTYREVRRAVDRLLADSELDVEGALAGELTEPGLLTFESRLAAIADLCRQLARALRNLARDITSEDHELVSGVLVRRAAQGSATELGRRPAECRIGLAVNRSRPHRAGRDVAKSRPALRSSVRGPAEN